MHDFSFFFHFTFVNGGAHIIEQSLKRVTIKQEKKCNYQTTDGTKIHFILVVQFLH